MDRKDIRVSALTDRQPVAGLGMMLTFKEAGQRGGFAEITAKRLSKRKDNPLPTIRIAHGLVRISEVQFSQWLASQVKEAK
jgi:hypothetical protein